jgi:hypothetical protein
VIIILAYSSINRVEKLSSAVYLRNVSENFGTGILNNFKAVKNMLNERLILNFIPIKFKEILARKCWQRLLFPKISTIYTHFAFFNLLVSWHVLFIMVDKLVIFYFLMMGEW